MENLKVFIDSQLVADQVTNEYEARDSTLAKYFDKVRILISALKYSKIFYIPQWENI